jgi:hypothetical protein
MIDVTTKELLQVRDAEKAWPYIRVSRDQAEKVLQLLESNGIRHWRSEDAISFDGGPYMTIINLGRNGNAQAAQALLDSIP